MADPMKLRRVVTGHDADGKAIVLFDGAPSINVRNDEGTGLSVLWTTNESPVDNSGSEDAAKPNLPIPPGPNGTVFRIVEFPADPEAGFSDEEAEHHRHEISSRGAIIPETLFRHPGMHRTNSIDYALVMEGEIDMLLDDSEVHLTAGDLVVQRGTNHAWANRSGAPCRIAFILIDAVPAI